MSGGTKIGGHYILPEGTNRGNLEDLTFHSRYRNLLRQIGAIRGTGILIYRRSKMAGPSESGGLEVQDDREVTPPPLTKEQIEGHLSALRSIIKDQNRKNKTDPIRLDFEEEDTTARDTRIVRGKRVVDDDLRKPFNEALKTPLTRRIIEFDGLEYKMPTNIKLYDGTPDPEDHLGRFTSAPNSGEWPMPVWCRMFQQTLDGPARGWFERLPANTINEWSDLRQACAARYSVRKACFEEPHEITKIVRRANESLTAFKERWTVEIGFIMGVPEVMKIPSFMDSLKCPELVKRFSDKAPTTVNEMMRRLDDFVRSEKAFAQTELPKGKTWEQHRKSYFPLAWIASVLTLDSLIKPPKEILATKTQLRLPPPRPMLNPQKGGNMDRYCDYHQEKGYHTNDCHQLRRQLETALESGKLNHLVRDVRQRGRGNQRGEGPQQAKIINMIRARSVKEKKRKAREMTKELMNSPITFPPVSTEDVLDEPLIVEAEVEGYLVRRVDVDGGASVEVMFEYCFENLSPKIKVRLRETHTNLVGFAGEATKPLGKIELEAVGKETGGRIRGKEGGGRDERGQHDGGSISEPGISGSVGRYRRKTSQGMQISIETPIEKQHGYIFLGARRYDGSSSGDHRTQFKCQHIYRAGVPETKGLGTRKSDEVARGVGKWVKADIVRSVKYPTWISNPVLVKKCDGAWRMCIDFKNLNSACPKDYYPLPNIDCKVESVMGFKYKCFLDAYKGYHQIQMSKEDEEKTVFYTDQGTYCYTKMPFRLKNTGATYQRLIDSTFQSQIGKNLEAYVDDMVIKRNDEKMLLADVAETLDNLRKINMKLNPKKCSFGVEEGKFLGYMVTSEGIRANPKKTRSLADLQSPRTLKEMQSLAGKLAALNRFLAKSAERSLPFFDILKNITKENKHEYMWTIEAEEAF
ncbi:reverse transcriptase domain-containing protein [Tanacetum coccineum]